MTNAPGREPRTSKDTGSFGRTTPVATQATASRPITVWPTRGSAHARKRRPSVGLLVREPPRRHLLHDPAAARILARRAGWVARQAPFHHQQQARPTGALEKLRHPQSRELGCHMRLAPREAGTIPLDHRSRSRTSRTDFRNGSLGSFCQRFMNRGFRAWQGRSSGGNDSQLDRLWLAGFRALLVAQPTLSRRSAPKRRYRPNRKPAYVTSMNIAVWSRDRAPFNCASRVATGKSSPEPRCRCARG